jgi:hypothetical protein
VTHIAENLFLIPDQLDPSNMDDVISPSSHTSVAAPAADASDDAGNAGDKFLKVWLAKITGASTRTRERVC